MRGFKLHSQPLTLAVLITLLAAFGLVAGRPKETSQPNSFALKAPAFVSPAYAGSSQIGDYLDSEAGIAAYYNSGFSIDLNSVRSAYRTIETETADYVIGSIAVPSYEEHFDPHVYVHKSGWIMAYYLRADPVSKIIDTKGESINTTILKTTVGTMASAAGVPFTDVTYYDFRYPNATKMLFVAEDYANGNDFTIRLPSSYGYFERGWACYGSNCGFNLNGTWNPNNIFDTYGLKYGTITAGQLLPDIDHKIISGGSGYAVLVIVYRD